MYKDQWKSNISKKQSLNIQQYIFSTYLPYFLYSLPPKTAPTRSNFVSDIWIKRFD